MNAKVPALEKGLKIIELMMAISEPITLSQIADRLGYKVSEIQRTIGYLLFEQYLIRNSAGSYMPGPKMYRMADQNREAILINRAAGPMRTFVETTGASIHLSVLVEDMLHVIYEVEGKGTVRISIRPGLYDAEATASGRLLLTYAGSGRIPSEEQKQVITRGYMFRAIDCVKGVYVIAVPVVTTAGACVAALASPYVLNSDARSTFCADLLEPLKRTATNLSTMI
jgi:DNA-binding IclR family transcriptional regulator